MIVWSWLPFSGLCHFCGRDVDCGRWFLWTLVVHPPCQADVISHQNLQGDLDRCRCRADHGVYHRQYSRDHHVRGLHLFAWFQCSHGKVHLPMYHSMVLGEIHLHCRFPRYIPSPLLAQRCLMGLLVGIKCGHSTPRRKCHPTVIFLLGMLGPISSKV